MSLFLDLLPREKADAIRRGERVEILGVESQRFQVAFAEAQRSAICQSPCLFRDQD